MIYARKGDLATAEKLLRQALEDDPQYKEGHLNLGSDSCPAGQKYPSAEQELDKAVALAPQDPNTLSTVGKAKAQMGKMSEGIALLRKVVDLAPDLAAAHLDLALALADSYDLPGALVRNQRGGPPCSAVRRRPFLSRAGSVRPGPHHRSTA